MKYQTIMLACVVPGDTHEDAVRALQRLLGEVMAHAQSVGNAELVSLVDECWMPNDCPNSEWPVLFAHSVTAADLVRAEMQRINEMPMRDAVSVHEEVRRCEPALELWEDDIHNSAREAAKHVCDAAGAQTT